MFKSEKSPGLAFDIENAIIYSGTRQFQVLGYDQDRLMLSLRDILQKGEPFNIPIRALFTVFEANQIENLMQKIHPEWFV